MRELEKLNNRRVPFILSYDGRTGNKTFGKELPRSLEMHRIEIEAGRSTQSTLLGGNAVTYESVYVSRSLAERIGVHPHELARHAATLKATQLELIAR